MTETFFNNINMNPSLVSNPLNTKLNPICHLMALLGAHHILHVSRMRFKLPGWYLNFSTWFMRNTYINIQQCISQTQQNFIMFIIVLRQHVSILIESSSGPSKIQILTWQCLECAVGSQKLTFLI